ncbi:MULTISPECIES: DUF3168 domain-containing protein [Mesorhizobium]|uniref:DUF3168 domain-containing protein n=1 Tax=Mesorhizobium denitrificans TaxID=2294114 RepID=A0A371XHQ1_9HYPH|nr:MULTISPECIES: DUF3168 domain-containing protein [Mesorhizobium]RFC68758.1 DUF3168 domain-containing protein [Mesorhizobium denitrificans]
MASAAIELQKAVFALLQGDATLTTMLGGAKVFDHTKSDVAFPYVTFGRTSFYDWSTGTEIGTEHLFTLHVWSKAKGKQETLDIMQRLETLLHDKPLAMSGFRLVNLRQEFAETRFDEDQSVYHGLIRFRAVVEAG